MVHIFLEADLMVEVLAEVTGEIEDPPADYQMVIEEGHLITEVMKDLQVDEEMIEMEDMEDLQR